MKLFDMFKKNNLDEYQEQQLLKIEHNGCWLAFWGSFAGLLYEEITNMIRLSNSGEYGPQITPIKILFFVLAIYMVAASARHGIWDRHLKPNAKTNVIISIIAGAAVAILNIVMFAVTGLFEGEFIYGVIGAIIGGVFTFLLCIAALTFVMKKYKKQYEKLENESEEA